MMNRYKPVGWRQDSHRHYLAAKYGSARKYSATTSVKFKKEFLNNPDWADYRARLKAEQEGVMQTPAEMEFHPVVFEESGKNPLSYEAFLVQEANKKKLNEQLEAEGRLPLSSKLKLYAMKDWFKGKEGAAPKDDSGIFGSKFKNDSHMTDSRVSDSERKNRVWEDRIQQEVDKGELKSEALDEYRELFKNLQRQFVNKEITRDQFEMELQSKGDWLVQRHKKSLDIWGPIHGKTNIPAQGGPK